MDNTSINSVLSTREYLLRQEQKLCLSTIETLNSSYKDLLEEGFALQLFKNCSKDIAGEVCRRYFTKLTLMTDDNGNQTTKTFDTEDYYITVDQFIERILFFSYDDDNDVFSKDTNLRKNIYNFTSSINSATMKDIATKIKESQTQLFTENRSKDKADRDGKKRYRESKRDANGHLYDELTGKQEGYSKVSMKNGNEYLKSDLHADHILPRESTTFNSRFIKKEKIESLKAFYNSDDNFVLTHASANASKGDVRVCNVNGEIKYMNTKEKGYDPKNDITYKATPEQMTQATIHQLEKETASNSKIDKLKEVGYLDENGKVTEDVAKKIQQDYINAMNKESLKILDATDYEKVAKNSLSYTKGAAGKILAGQVIYYILPPVVHETQKIIRKKDLTLEKFFKELKKAGARIISYVTKKLGEILSNVVFNSINKFLKSFFDIIIEMVRATVEKMIKAIKSVALSLVQCARTLVDTKSTAAQKADSITKILSSTIITIVLEVLFEYLEHKFNLPDILMEPLQIVVSTIAINISMLVLQKADLFNVKYGFLSANIEQIFNEQLQIYNNESTALFNEQTVLMENELQMIYEEIDEIRDNLMILSPYDDTIIKELEKIEQLFNIDINFNTEWNRFLAVI